MLCSTPCSITYRDELPDGCPPDEAEVIVERRVFYRAASPIIDPIEDFQSLFQENPDFKPQDMDPCILRGVTVWETLEAAENMRRLWQCERKSKKWEGKQNCELTLDAGAGAILRTESGQPAEQGEHWTWWPAKDFDILAHSKPLKARH